MAGFRPVTRTNIELQVDQVARIDFKLELGSATESVLVQAQAGVVASPPFPIVQKVSRSTSCSRRGYTAALYCPSVKFVCCPVALNRAAVSTALKFVWLKTL